jgi:beta-lactamase class A
MESCKTESKKTIEDLKTNIVNDISKIDGDVAIALYDLNNESNTITININETFHAASTMKVPVMIELYKQQNEGLLNLNDSIVLVNEFKSIVDGSSYSMDIGDDSDDIIYSKIGTKQTLYDLMVPMITVSSNLATNVLIEIVEAKKVTQTMRSLGADNIEVLRGVEDQKAYDLGLSNSTTANDLLAIMKAIANGEAGTKEDCDAMIAILKDQKWNDMIPKYLPETVEVAHKTGSITGVHHDAAIVYLPDGGQYVLVLLSKNLSDFDAGTDQLAQISKTIYDYMIKN